jgi:hypothetical protein
MGRLLSRTTKASLLKSMTLLYNAAQSAHVPARISECNSVYSGGQKGLSDVFGASLWAADFMFSLANAGILGVNFHGGGNYTPIAVSSSGVVSVRPEYYGIMLFKYGSSGSFVHSSVSDTLANIGVYALRCGSDSMRIIIINKDSLTSYEVTVTGIPFDVPASLIRMSAPSLYSATGLRLGGDSIGVAQPWVPSMYETVSAGPGGYLVSVPAASVAVLTARRQLLVTQPGMSTQQMTPANVRVFKGRIFIRAPADARVRISLYLANGRVLAQEELKSNGSQMQIPLSTKSKRGVCFLAIEVGDARMVKMVLPGFF